MSVLYEERAPYTNIMKLLTVATLGLPLGFYVYAVAGGAPLSAYLILRGTAVILGVVLGVTMWCFWNMNFILTNSAVEATFGFYRYRIPFNEIIEVKVVEAPSFLVGWGLRIWDARIAFVSQHKPSVMIQRNKGKFRKILLTTHDPERFSSLLQAHLSK